MATDDTTAQDGDPTSSTRGKPLYSRKRRTSTAYFLLHRAQVDAIARQVEFGELSQLDAVYQFVCARDVLAEQLTQLFCARVQALTAKRNQAEAPADTEQPSAGPG